MPKITTLIVESSNKWLKISLALILVIILALTGLNYFGIIDLSKYLPFLPKRSQPQTVELIHPFSLDSCLIKKEGNPLVLEISANDFGSIGKIQGVVDKISTEPIREATIISLSSLDKKQQYNFSLFEQPNLIVDLSTNKVASLSALKQNQTLTLSFSCSKESNLFKFTRVTIER